jgi:hypothetical protein
MLLHEGDLVLGQASGLLDFAHYNSRNARDLGRGAGGAGLPRTKQIITIVDPSTASLKSLMKLEAAQLAIGEYFEARSFWRCNTLECACLPVRVIARDPSARGYETAAAPVDAADCLYDRRDT